MRRTRSITLAAAGALALLAPHSHAAEYYAGADAAYLRVPVASADFGGFGIKFRAGASLPSGWGLELQTLFGLGDDRVGDLALETDNITAGFLRYETNPNADFRFFVVAGYALTSLSYGGPDTDGLDDSLSGFAYGFGAQEKVRWLPGTTAVLEANSFFSDSNVDIWAVSFGLRYDF